MFKQLSLSTPLRLPLAILAYSVALYGYAQSATAGVEPDSQSFGYYKTGIQQNSKDLNKQITELREELRQTREQIDGRLQRIEQSLKPNPVKQAVQQTSVPAPVAKPPAPVNKSGKLLSVCQQGCDYADLQKAVDAAAPGSEIDVAAEINGSCAVIGKALHLVGKQDKDGRRAHLVGGLCNGKAPLVTAAANITIEGFEISGIAVGDGNGACIRLDPGTQDLTVRDIYCHDSQDGLLGESKGHFLIENSRFVGNGFGNGQAHGLYISGDDILIRHSQILSTQNAGHSIKSGARKLTIEDSLIAALNGHNSRAIDAYGGGEIVLLRNVIQQGPQSDNSDVIGLALEASRLLPDGHSLKMSNNWVIFDDPDRGGVLIRGRLLGPVVASGNTFVGLKGLGLDGVQEANNHWVESREEAGLPAFDGTVASLPRTAPHN
jgi:Right handed beta helix region